MMKAIRWNVEFGLILLCAVTTIASPAQTFTVLASFGGTNGGYPYLVSLTQGEDGNFYGTTLYGGRVNDCNHMGCGTVFKVTPSGVLTSLHLFCDNLTCTDGADPSAGLVLGPDGNFYGATSAAGAYGFGTVFKITPVGVLTTIHAFCSEPNCADGGVPTGSLLLAANGNLYGTTESGGGGYGTVFEITMDGTLTTLAQFDNDDGSTPSAGLVQAFDGSFYGTASEGGAYGFGAAFTITESDLLTPTYSFCPLSGCTDGAYPRAALVQAFDGNFYGTTSQGGVGSGDPNIGGGTLFKMTPNGELKTLYSFCVQTGCADGFFPAANLFQGADGNLYGTTVDGGRHGGGEIFRFTPPGRAPAIMHNFCATVDKYDHCTDGDNPWGGLLQATNGIFYGTTSEGGVAKSPQGTVYSLSMGLGPFVAFVQVSGKVGQSRGVLGQGFTGATAVSFGGRPASFTVVSDTFIKATVPPGATTGYVTVTTPTGVLSSNVPFHVIP